MGESNIWFTADTHFGHSAKPDGRGGIINHAKRPFVTIEEHDAYLIKRWNETVDKKSTVYILGDMCWRDHRKYVNLLNGKKILITGSHDKMSQLSSDQFTEVHVGMHTCMINKQFFVLSHCCFHVWERSHYGSIHLYAHSHGRLLESDTMKRMDVGVDVSDDYAPFSLEFILYKMSLKKPFDYQYSDPDQYVGVNKENNKKLIDEFNKNNT